MRDEKSGKESKQVNFRIDPDSAEAFRLFCTTHGMNQAQGFDHLIQVLELNNAKAATPGRAVEIENFERLLKEILSAYIGSIELSSNAEARVLERFQSDLKRKDKTIDELREKVETIAGEKNNQDAALTALKEEQVRTKEQAQHAISQLESAKKATADQEEIVSFRNKISSFRRRPPGMTLLKNPMMQTKKKIQSFSCGSGNWNKYFPTKLLCEQIWKILLNRHLGGSGS